MQRLLFLLCFFCTVSFAQAPQYDLEPYPFKQPQDAARFTQLTNQIRCVVCQFQTIADSDATIAADLRNRVYDMVLAKKTDQEIKDYLVKRYGDVILLKPRFSLLTLFLWLGPLGGILIALALLLRKIHWAKPQTT